MTSDALAEARAAYARRDWKTAEEAYARADAESPLPCEELERHAMAMHLLGRESESRELFSEGYRRALERGESREAARCAFWIGHGFMFSGDASQCQAWSARARSLLDEAGLDCVERGLLLVIEGVRQLFGGDPPTAERTFARAREAGRAYGDINLVAMASHGLGRSRIALGRIDEGMAVLDEAMVAATEGELVPIVVGDLYCGVLDACHQVFDFRRAREWTAALTRWCESQPDLVPYRGPCLVHRVELMRIHGDWPQAVREARKACEWLSAPLSPEGPGDAYYELAELHRLRGELAEADEAYRQASRCGRSPEPGLPMLWFAKGQAEAARTALRRALDEASGNPGKRAGLFGSYVEVLLALDDAEPAAAAAAELATIAASFDAPALHAAAARANGRVLIHRGMPSEALGPLRRAWTLWQGLDAPFEAARERVQIGIAFRALGDNDSAAMEFDAARWVFQELGAAGELAALEALAPGPTGLPLVGGLTHREYEVLRLVATGRTNKEIAGRLVISEHTVARHVQNMLAKLGFPSRTRLATFAIEQGIAASTDSQD